MRALITFALTNAERERGIPWFVESLISEVLDELGDLDPDDMTSYLLYTSQIMRWAATGDTAELPEVLREHQIALPSAEPTDAHQ